MISRRSGLYLGQRYPLRCQHPQRLRIRFRTKWRGGGSLARCLVARTLGDFQYAPRSMTCSPRMRACPQRWIDGGNERFEVERSVVTLAVDEKARRAVHSALQAAHEIAVDLGFERMSPKSLTELFARQAKLLRRGEVELGP